MKSASKQLDKRSFLHLRPMARVIVSLMIMFMAIGPIAHGFLAFKFSALQTLSPEEETHDEKPQCKAKLEIKDQLLNLPYTSQVLISESIKTTELDQLIILSKGYAGNLLMPPDATNLC